jgi:hypothetical protein
MERIPTCTNSFTTMLKDGAPMPLVADITAVPLGKYPNELCKPR